MKYLIAALAIFSGAASAASSEECIRDTMFKESQGAPVEHAIAIGHNVLNRAKRTGKGICRVAKSGYTQKTPTSGPLKGAFLVLAQGVINGAIPDPTDGADSYTDRKRPPHPGVIKRQIVGTTFYRMKEVPLVR